MRSTQPMMTTRHGGNVRVPASPNGSSLESGARPGGGLKSAVRGAGAKAAPGKHLAFNQNALAAHQQHHSQENVDNHADAHNPQHYVPDDDGASEGAGSRSSGGSSVRSADHMMNHIGALISRLHVCGADGRELDSEIVLQSVLQSVSHCIRTMAPMAILVMDANCELVDVNPKAEEIFGRTSDDLVGKNIKCIMPPEIASKHDAIVAGYIDKYERTRKPPRSNIVGAKEGREVLALRMVNGKPTTFNAKVAVRGIPHPAGRHVPPLFFLGYVEDVTERRKLKEALEINEFIREKGDTPLIVMSDYGKILDFNQAAADMFRYNRRFVIGQNIKKLMPPEIAAVHDEKLETYRERVSTGMLHTSPVVGMPRILTGYRPKFESSGCEEFKLELRVESFSGGKILVAFVSDLSQKSESAFHSQTTADTFPPHTHERLMRGEPVWDEQHNITVMFTDIVSFSAQSAEMEPEEVFTFVNRMVSAFDEMGYGMEKIKTIGDGYMAFFTSADDAIYTGLRMVEFCNENGIGLRIGLHTGTVVSGVIGTRRRTFDMWGETVNLSKQMEDHGVANQVHVSADTFDAIENDELKAIFMGHSANVKGIGVITTYVTDLPEDMMPEEVVAMLADRDVEERNRQAVQNMKDQSTF